MTDMKVELRDDLNPDQIAAMAARGDYMDESLVGTTFEEAMEGTDLPLDEYLEDKAYKGHFGVFEHTSPAFFIEGLSRVAMAQVTRHRHLSFDVQSQRYVDFSGKQPVVPPSFEDRDYDPVAGATWGGILRNHFDQSVRYYRRAIEAGIPKEDARFFLPEATPVNMTMSGNNRALMHFLDLRDNGAAQWEAQEFASKVSDELLEHAPKTFGAYEKHIDGNSLRAP